MSTPPKPGANGYPDYTYTKGNAREGMFVAKVQCRAPPCVGPLHDPTLRGCTQMTTMSRSMDAALPATRDPRGRSICPWRMRMTGQVRRRLPSSLGTR